MLEGATEMGGCPYFLPESHKLGRIESESEWDDKTSSYGSYIVPKETILKAMAECPEPVAVTGPPGSAALFHCNLMHGSSHNLSKHARWHSYTALPSPTRPVPWKNPDRCRFAARISRL
ncbi:MAG: ectoine hydroxylase [Rhodothermales bacterium]|jgi:ectoine hydroxylase